MGTLHGTYSLSRATAVYLQGSYLSNSSQARYSLSSGGGTTPAAGQNQTGLMAGIRHAFQAGIEEGTRSKRQGPRRSSSRGVFSVSANFQARMHRTKLSAARQTCSVSDGLAVHPILVSAGYRL